VLVEVVEDVVSVVVVSGNDCEPPPPHWLALEALADEVVSRSVSVDAKLVQAVLVEVVEDVVLVAVASCNDLVVDVLVVVVDVVVDVLLVVVEPVLAARRPLGCLG